MSRVLPGRFPGGLELAGRKSLSNGAPIRAAGLPPVLVFPLRQRSGATARPLVRPGDRVWRGSRIAGGDHPLDPPIHASTSGQVIAIEARPMADPTDGLGRCIVITPDGRDEDVPPRPALNLDDCPPEVLLERIHAAGIAGLGGAAFPAAAKLATCGMAIEILILNGAECEPYLSADDRLLRERAGEVLRGGAILRRMLGAATLLIAIKADMPEALAAMTAAGTAGRYEPVQVVQVPARYPAGGEKQLIQMLTGREVPAGALPAAIGVHCQNVATAAAVYRAVERGAALTSRIVTVTGRGVRSPGNLEVRLGTPVACLIAECGGYTEDAERLLLGGPLMGLAVATDQAPVTPAVNGILVAGAGELAALMKPSVTWPSPGPSQASSYLATLPCIRCGACAEVCPARLLPQQLHWLVNSRQLERALDQQLSDCIECGCCDAVCPSHIPLVHQFQSAKREARARTTARAKAEQARRRFEARQTRLDEAQRERERAAAQRKAGLRQNAPAKLLEALARAQQKRNPGNAVPGRSDTVVEAGPAAGESSHAAG